MSAGDIVLTASELKDESLCDWARGQVFDAIKTRLDEATRMTPERPVAPHAEDEPEPTVRETIRFRQKAAGVYDGVIKAQAGIARALGCAP